MGMHFKQHQENSLLLKLYLNNYFSRFKKEILSRVLLIYVMDLLVRYRSPTENLLKNLLKIT